MHDHRCVHMLFDPRSTLNLLSYSLTADSRSTSCCKRMTGLAATPLEASKRSHVRTLSLLPLVETCEKGPS